VDPPTLQRDTTEWFGGAGRWRWRATSPKLKASSIARIAERLGRSAATAYFYDPTGEKARAVKARYRGVCRGCGASTSARNGKGDAYAY
jgi:hypothetical protein